MLIEFEDQVQFDEKRDFEIELKFLTLLYEKTEDLITISASSEECFDPASQKIDAFVQEVCVFDLRNIVLIPNLAQAALYPNPAKDEIRLDLELAAKNNVNIYLHSMTGKLYRKKKNLNLEKGEHSLIFQIDSLQNGVYILTVEFNELTKSLMFIKSQ